MRENILTLDSVAPDWLSNNLSVLEDFLESPAGFILGALLSEIIGGVETLFVALLDGITVIFVGTDGEVSTTGVYGIADIPLVIASTIAGWASPVVPGILFISNRITGAAIRVASLAGPFSPIILGAEIGLLIAITVWVGRRAVSILADAIPGAQGLIK